ENSAITYAPTGTDGTALFASGHHSTATSPARSLHDALPISTPGTYFLYYRWKADPARTAGDAFTANSFKVPLAFGAFSTPGDAASYETTSSNQGSAQSDNRLLCTQEVAPVVYTVSQSDVSAA